MPYYNNLLNTNFNFPLLRSTVNNKKKNHHDKSREKEGEGKTIIIYAFHSAFVLPFEQGVPHFHFGLESASQVNAPAVRLCGKVLT